MKYNLRQSGSNHYDLVGLICDVKDQANIEDVAKALDLTAKCGLQQIGSSLQGDCPTGHVSTGHKCFSIDLGDNLYHCFSCNIGGDIVDLVATVNGVGRFEATRWIVEKVCPELASRVDAAMSTQSAELKELNDRGFLYRLIFENGRQQLQEPIAASVMDYLTNVRGYDRSKIVNTEWIYWDTDKNIRDYLAATVPDRKEQIDTLDLQGGYGDNFRLALPYRNRHGVIVGYLKRAHAKAGFTVNGEPGIRWDSTKGLKKSDLYGLNRIRNTKDLTIVEGYPDAAYLPAVGLSNIVAIGQGAFSEKYVDGLLAKGIQRVVIALDNDGETGLGNTERACQLLAGSGIRVFVLDPPTMGAHKDPDEFVMAMGVDAFRNLVEHAQEAPSWMVGRILAKHDTATDLGKDRAITECLEYSESLSEAREAEGVLKALIGTLGITEEVLIVEYGALRERKAGEVLREGAKKMASRVGRLIDEGNAVQALEVLQAGISEMQSGYWRHKEPEALPLDAFLDAKRSTDSQRAADVRLGYELKDFAEIDKALRGLQKGLYIVAADPNIGKTALMVSLMLDVLKSNPDVSCLFYSMDDNKDMIVNRLLAHVTDLRINEVRCKMPTPDKERQLDAGYTLLKSWFQQERLDIRDGSASMTMGRIQSEIRAHKRVEKLVVFLDGLYNVPLEADHNNIREENIDRANRIKQIVVGMNIPVIATAEFRKQGREESHQSRQNRSIHDIMETGKYGYNADVIVLLSPKDWDNYHTQDEPIIVAEFGKNKLESFRGSMEFKFVRAKSVMTFVTGSTQGQ